MPSADIRATAVRLARSVQPRLERRVESLVHDPSPEVRRECAIALRNVGGPSRSRALGRFGRAIRRSRSLVPRSPRNRGRRRLGRLPRRLAEQGRLEAWKLLPAGRDIVWRSRAAKTPELLAAILKTFAHREPNCRAICGPLISSSGPKKSGSLASLAFGDRLPRFGPRVRDAPKRFERLDRKTCSSDPAHVAALKRVVAASRGTRRFVDLIERFELPGYSDDLLALAQANSENELGVRAVMILLSQTREGRDRRGAVLEPRSADRRKHDPRLGKRAGSACERVCCGPSSTIASGRSTCVGRRSARSRRTKAGAAQVLAQAEAANSTQACARRRRRPCTARPSSRSALEPTNSFPLPRSADAKPLPSIQQLPRVARATAQKGRIVFATIGTCAKCHVVNGEGKDVGPNLSEIGAKLSRPAIYESILFPERGDQPQFRGVHARPAERQRRLGHSDQPHGRLDRHQGDRRDHAHLSQLSEVEEIKEQPISLMPADLQKAMTADDLVNVVEYLTTSRHATAAKANGDPKKPTLTDHKEAAIAP